LNPIIEAIIPPFDKHNAQIKEEDNNMFGVGLILKSLLGHLLLHNSLYFKNYPSHNPCIDPLAWWWTHEVQFLNVILLAKHIFEIPRSQIETKRAFNLVGVLIILRCYHLQVENLDRIIKVTKKE